MKVRAAVASIALMLATATTAHADENRVAAEALFDEGLKLFDQGKLADACPKFAASHKLDPASGTLLNLGRCYEKLGKTASAWLAYRDLISLAHKENNPKREAQAKQAADKLQSKLAKLTLEAPEGVQVKVDQTAVEPAQLKVPVPIDPGEHVIDASAPGKKPWTKSLKIVDAENALIAVPALEDDPTAVAPPPPPPATTSAKESAGLGPMRIAALGAGGLGVVGLAVGGVFGGIALSNASTARDHCVGRCDGEGLDAREDARSMADVSTVGLIAGGVLLAGGVVLWLVAPQKRASSAMSTTMRTSPISLQF